MPNSIWDSWRNACYDVSGFLDSGLSWRGLDFEIWGIEGF